MQIFKLCFLSLFLISSLSAKSLNLGFDVSTLEKFSKKDLKIATDIFLTKLLSQIGYEGNFYYYENLSQMSQDLRDNKLDYVSINAVSFLDYFDKSKVEASFTEGAYEKENLLLVVLVSAASNIRSWKDLKNKRIIFDLHDNVSKMYIDYSYLKANGNLDIDYLNAKTNQKAILKLFFNQADAAIVRYRNYKVACELNPQISKKVLVFEKTDIKNIQVGVYRKNLDDRVQTLLAREAYSVDRSVDGQQMLDLYKVEKLVKTDFNDLEKVEYFYKNLNKLKKRELP